MERKTHSSTEYVQFKDGTIVIEKEQVQQRQNEYIGEFFGENKTSMHKTQKQSGY